MKNILQSNHIKTIFIIGGFFAIFWILFFAFQQPSIYNNTLGKVSHNYEIREDGMRNHVQKPFIDLNNTTAIQWDAVHYELIKDHGYSVEKAGGDYIYAFFPLFPYIWRFFGLSAVGVIFLNFLMFATAVVLLSKLFKFNLENIFIICSIPVLTIFFLPHTESTFLLMFSIAIYGYFKDKYWLYFTGMVLAALSRNTFVVVLPAIFCAELLFLTKEKQITQSLKRIFFGILPLLVGTAIFTTIQYVQGSGNIFKFIEIQKQWDNLLSFPDILNIRDWSHESFGVNLPTLIMMGLPFFVYLGVVFFNQVFSIKKEATILKISSSNKKDYAFTVLLMCCIAAVFSVIFYRHGSLNGLSRFLLCTPYFILFVFIGFEKIKYIKSETRGNFFFISLFFSLILFYEILYTGKVFIFSHLGFLIFVAMLWLFIFQDSSKKYFYRILLYSTFLLNILWSSYLFNMYLSNGWMYT